MPPHTLSSRRTWWLLATYALLATLLVGCAAARVPARTTVPRVAEGPHVLVLMPELETPIEGVTVEALSVALRAGLEREASLSVDVAPVGTANSFDADCIARVACLRELGRSHVADYVVVVVVVALGDTALVRARFVEVAGGQSEFVRQSVVEPVAQSSLDGALTDFGIGFATRFIVTPEATPSRARRRWRWLGPTLVAVLVGAATTTFVALRQRPAQPDIVIIPP